MTPDLPPVLPGFSEPIRGPLRVTSSLAEHFDISLFYNGSWREGGCGTGTEEGWYSLRLGSPIALANGIGGEDSSTGDDERFARESLPAAPVSKTRFDLSKERCMKLADLEGDSTIGAGSLESALRKEPTSDPCESVVKEPSTTETEAEAPISADYVPEIVRKSAPAMKAIREDLEKLTPDERQKYLDLALSHKAKPEAEQIFTCPASRHVAMMAEELDEHGRYVMFEEDPKHCAGSMRATVGALWKAREELSQANAANRDYLVRVSKDAHHIAQLEQDIGKANAALGELESDLAAARADLAREVGERQRAVAYSSSVERGEVKFTSLAQKELEKILTLGLKKDINESLGDVVVREIQRLRAALEAYEWKIGPAKGGEGTAGMRDGVPWWRDGEMLEVVFDLVGGPEVMLVAVYADGEESGMTICGTYDDPGYGLCDIAWYRKIGLLPSALAPASSGKGEG